MVSRRWTLFFTTLGTLLLGGAAYLKQGLNDDGFAGFILGVGTLGCGLFIWFTAQEKYRG